VTTSASLKIQFPVAPDDLTPRFLTDVLRVDGAIDSATSITAVESERVGEGVGLASNLYRLRLGSDGVAPTTLIVKLPTTSPYRALAEALGVYQCEVAFYRDVAGRAPVRTPKCYLAAQAVGSIDFVLILEDLGFMEACDHIEGLSLARTDRILTEAARLHAWSMTEGRALVDNDAFLSVTDPVFQGFFTAPFRACWETYRANARQPVPALAEEFARNYVDLVPSLFEQLQEPIALTFGDFRVDNLFFDHDGEPAVVDFQFAMRASGIYDVAYLVSQGLTTENRKGQDRRFVQHYLRALSAAGGPDFEFDQAWRQFQVASAILLGFPILAMTYWDDLPERARNLCLTLVERSLATLAETGALDLVTA
jgi:Ecdysteroid kinase-like family